MRVGRGKGSKEEERGLFFIAFPFDLRIIIRGRRSKIGIIRSSCRRLHVYERNVFSYSASKIEDGFFDIRGFFEEERFFEDKASSEDAKILRKLRFSEDV